MRSKYIYTLSGIFVLCWWLVAFHRPVAYEVIAPQYTDDGETKPPCSPHTLDAKTFFNIQRSELKQALDGDVVMMGKLIAEWDLEAELAEHQGCKNVKRIDHDRLIQSQLLTKILKTQDSILIAHQREMFRRALLIDNSGTPFDLTIPAKTFLPQTYLSAGILISLCDPDAIVGLPKGLRLQEHIYPLETTEWIPNDIDSFHTERLSTLKPDIALISERYTHPLTLQALENQNIATFHVGDVTSLEDLEELIRSLGHLCNRPLKAELLALFVHAAAIAIDNNRELSVSSAEKAETLVLNYHTKFSLPGTRTLTRSLIERIGVCTSCTPNKPNYEDYWSTPVSEERIIHFNPKNLLIITASEPEDVLNYFYDTPLFHHIDAALNHRVSVLDEAIQQTISQYVILAYYDLNQALVGLHAH